VAITFPQWNGSNTVLQARREYRVLRQPLIINVTRDSRDDVPVRHAAERVLAPGIQTVETGPTPFQPETLSLDGDWELAWCEKGQGPPTNGWRSVKVPGSVHTQWLAPSKIYSREAEWLSYKEWWYRRNFAVDERWAGKRVLLQFGATDYYTDVRLNGKYLGRHEGYIDPYQYDIASMLRSNEVNELLV